MVWFTFCGSMGTVRMVIAVPLPASRKPESKPLIVMSVSCAGVQGEENVDCVAVWLPNVTEKKDGVK